MSDPPVILQSLTNVQAIKKKVDTSILEWQKKAEQYVPELTNQLNRINNAILQLEQTTNQPLHKIVHARNRLNDAKKQVELEIQNYTDETLVKKFKEKSTQACQYINTTMKIRNNGSEEELEQMNRKRKLEDEEEQERKTDKVAKETTWDSMYGGSQSSSDKPLESLDLDDKDEKEEDKSKEIVSENQLQYFKETFKNPVALFDGLSNNMEEIHKNLLNLKRLHLVDDEIAMAASASAPKPGTVATKPFCKKCKLPLFCTINQSKLVCKNCSELQEYTDSQTLSLAFHVDSDWQHNVYERYTHLMDIIEPFRPRKRVEIPEKVYDEIRALMRQNRFALNKKLTFPKVQTYLEDLNYRDLYEHKHQITMELNGEYWPIMTEEQEWIIVLTFLMMQTSFESAKNARSLFDSKKSKRSSFLKYEFVTYHICRMLGFHQFCPYLKLLQVPTRHRKQLRLLRLICKDLGWSYVPQMW